MRPLQKTIAAATFALFAATTVYAQTAQGQGSGQFGQWREKHKYTFQLTSMVRHIGQIDRDPKYALTQAQAKKTLAILQPLRKKPKLTQDEAKQALKQLKPVFTVNQLNAMAKIKPSQRRPGQSGSGMGRPGGPGATSGPRRPDGQGMRRMDPNAMKDFNPFYAKASAKDEFAKRRLQMWSQFFTSMDNKAKGKPEKPAVPAKAKPRK